MTDLREYNFTKKENIFFYIALIIAGVLISFLMYRNILFSMVVIPFAGRIKGFITDTIIRRRKRTYMAEFKDFLFMASTAIGAGRSMKDAIGESIPSLSNIHGHNAVLVKDLKKAYDRMENGRENDVSVLSEMADASGLEDVCDFVTIYAICKSSGASLIIALNRAAGVIMEKMSIEKEIQELVRRKESEGLIILITPAAVLVFLNMFAPDYIAPMYESLTGRLIMSITAVSVAGVYMMIRKITNVEI